MLAPPKPPSHDDPEDLIKEARARQLRRRLLGAAGVALVAALGLGAHALSVGGAGHARPTTAASAGAPLCRTSQLSTTFGTGGAAGTALGPLWLVNTADRACSLPVGPPAVQVIFRGKPLATREHLWGSKDFGTPAGQIVPPGKKRFFQIGWSSLCPNPAAAPESRHATLSVRFRGGLRLAVPDTPPDRFVSLPGCGEALHPTPSIYVSRLLRVG
jgi:hypothetical protein